MTGSRQEAWQRLQSPISVGDLHEKHEEEFLELHPFRPQTKAAQSPRMPREARKVDEPCVFEESQGF